MFFLNVWEKWLLLSHNIAIWRGYRQFNFDDAIEVYNVVFWFWETCTQCGVTEPYSFNLIQPVVFAWQILLLVLMDVAGKWNAYHDENHPLQLHLGSLSDKFPPMVPMDVAGYVWSESVKCDVCEVIFPNSDFKQPRPFVHYWYFVMSLQIWPVVLYIIIAYIILKISP